MEKCNCISMPHYPFFISKLKSIQDIIGAHRLEYDQSDVRSECSKCSKCLKCKYYKLSNIVWPSTIQHQIKDHLSYPSEYFISVIINTQIINDRIINYPIELGSNLIRRFGYISLEFNKLLILDALMKQGSDPRYIVPEGRYQSSDSGRFIYSEHAGVISMTNKFVDNIIVSTETNRLDVDDADIYLPVNTDLLAQHEFLFHTHPNTSKYAGRLPDGIIYEFPSSSDVLNFVKFHNEGIAQASIIIAPEGMYVIRQIYYQDKFDIKMSMFIYLRKLILKLEKKAIDKLKPDLNLLSDPDVFHQRVSKNYKYIDQMNKFLKPLNILIEYYPREKKNGEWCLRSISLQYIDLESK